LDAAAVVWGGWFGYACCGSAEERSAAAASVAKPTSPNYSSSIQTLIPTKIQLRVTSADNNKRKNF